MRWYLVLVRPTRYSILDFNSRSMYSIVLYLNMIPKGCGGGTRFYRDEQKGCLQFDPEQQRCVLFCARVLRARAPRACTLFVSLTHCRDDLCRPRRRGE